MLLSLVHILIHLTDTAYHVGSAIACVGLSGQQSTDAYLTLLVDWVLSCPRELLPTFVGFS